MSALNTRRASKLITHESPPTSTVPNLCQVNNAAAGQLPTTSLSASASSPFLSSKLNNLISSSPCSINMPLHTISTPIIPNSPSLTGHNSMTNINASNMATPANSTHTQFPTPISSSPRSRAAAASMLLHSRDHSIINGWLEAMKESSPLRSRSPDIINHDKSAINMPIEDQCYRAWMAKHPSALDKFEQIMEAAAGKRIAMFLDYDGTLSPIIEDPDRAFMSEEMHAVLQDVASNFPTAIISGRCREKLYEFAQVPGLYYAGSHGMDIMGPAEASNNAIPQGTKALDEKGKEVVLFQPGKEFILLMNEVFRVLEDKVKKVQGAKVEYNKFCVTVHFRCVKEKNWFTLAEQVHEVVQRYPNLRLTHGRKILEIRPLIAWNKGKALEFLLKTLGLVDQNNVFAIYIGDDRSDEDAFKVLNRKKHGLGILVSSVVKDTNAVCSLRDPNEVSEFLKRLVKWKRRRFNRFP